MKSDAEKLLFRYLKLKNKQNVVSDLFATLEVRAAFPKSVNQERCTQAMIKLISDIIDHVEIEEVK